MRDDHAIDHAVGFEHDLALGNVEIEGFALVARAAHRAIRGKKRIENFFHDRLGYLIGSAGNRELRLLVMQPRGGADQHAVERVRALAPLGVDDHAHRERRAVLARPQRAQIVGDALGQHRHDAVGKIDRVAALGRRAIERRARPHVVRHVGNGDADDVAARIARVRSGTAWTASSWSLASGGSMVTNGTSRQSSRKSLCPRASPARAASDSASTARVKTCGMPWAWIAIRLTARSLLIEPSRSTTEPVGRPSRPWRATSTATRSPSAARRRRARRQSRVRGQAASCRSAPGDRRRPEGCGKCRACGAWRGR